MDVTSIKIAASKMGACNLIGNANGWGELARLFLSPQGIEFCLSHRFPTLADFREIACNDVAKHGVYVDGGVINLYNPTQDVALIGDTCAILSLTDTDRLYTVLLMHGAKAIVKAENYAVVKIEKTGDCVVTINADKTARIL